MRGRLKMWILLLIMKLSKNLLKIYVFCLYLIFCSYNYNLFIMRNMCDIIILNVLNFYFNDLFVFVDEE